MMRLRAGPIVVAMALAMLALPATVAAVAAERALLLEIDGAIGPPTADYIVRELGSAKPDRGPAGHSAHEHAGRSRHLDAPDHQRDPRFACAGRHLCRAERSARGKRRHLYRLCERNCGDGAEHQYWRRHAGSVRRQSAAAVGSEPTKRKTAGGQARRTGGRPDAQGRQRRRCLYSQPCRAQWPQCRLGRRGRAFRCKPDGLRGALASRHRCDRRRCP